MPLSCPINAHTYLLPSLKRPCSASLSLRELGQPSMHLRGGRVDHRAAVREKQCGHRLVAAVDAHHELCRGMVALDVDLVDLHAGPTELRLQSLAEPAPLRAVHRERHRMPPCRAQKKTARFVAVPGQCNN